jgi:glycosyltransferase involved in cell wall biosynthesis
MILSEPKDIAFIHEENNHLTGGRYYSWLLIHALVEMGHTVTVYTNRRSVFLKDLELYKQPKVIISASSPRYLTKLNVKADIYFGSPIHGAVAALKLGEKHNKPAFALVFDPFPAMKKYLGQRAYTGWDELLELLRRTGYVISLCDSMTDFMPEWLQRNRNTIFNIYPCINSKVLHKRERNFERDTYVVFISRLVRNKRFEDVLTACSRAGVKLKVISSVAAVPVQNLVNHANMRGQVEFRLRATDDEKFNIISRSSAVISASIFEGFGMFLAEAISTGTPAVLYDYPTFREQVALSGVDNVYLARYKNVADLSRKLKLCLEEKKFREPNDTFSFENMKQRLSQI